MRTEISCRKKDRFHNFVDTYSHLKMFFRIFFILLLPFLFSCFSSDQKTIPSPSKVEEQISEKVETPPSEAIQKIVETGENTQAGEPIRVQSTMTPMVDMQAHQEPMTANTSETQTSVQEPAPSEKEDKANEVSSTSESASKEAETLSPTDPLQKVKVGMNYDEVVKLIGEPDSLITKSADEKMKLYRWNREGKILYGRFESGILKRYSGKSAESENAPAPLTRELYDQLKEGMELDEVVAILQRAGTQISSDNKGGILYLWTDKEGSSFSARFENNKLVRKSGFYVRPAPVKESPTIEEEPTDDIEGTLEENIGNETGENTVEESKEDISDSNAQEQTPPVEEPIYQPPPRSVPQSVNREQVPPQSQNRRIIYAGSQKRFSDENQKPDVVKQSSLRRRVKLPDYTYQLRDGSYEIKIYNPLDTSVKVGLRSGKRGKNISIPAGGVKSIKVPRGSYQFVYIRDDEPSELQQGGSVTIDGLFIGDIEVMLLK